MQNSLVYWTLCFAGFTRHHSCWRTDFAKHSVGLRRETENLPLQGLFGHRRESVLYSDLKALYHLHTVFCSLLPLVCRSYVWSVFTQPQRKRRWHISLSFLTLAAGNDLAWWLITTAGSKTFISSHWAQRTHYPPNSYRLMGQVSIYKGYTSLLLWWLEFNYIFTQLCFPV